MTHASKHNGTKLELSSLRRLSKPALMASALLLVSLTVGGCQSSRVIPTFGTKPGPTDNQVQCAAWRRITYSKKDTAPTAQEIREHNATGRVLGCWQ